MLRVLLLVDTFKLLDAVSNALDFEDVIPEGVGNLDVVLDGSRVSELRFLGYTYELLDVVPLAFEKGCGCVGAMDWYNGCRGCKRKIAHILLF